MRSFILVVGCLLFGYSLQACPDCLEPEQLVLEPTVSNCVEIEVLCDGAECSNGVFPQHCLANEEVCVVFNYNGGGFLCPFWEWLADKEVTIKVGENEVTGIAQSDDSSGDSYISCFEWAEIFSELGLDNEPPLSTEKKLIRFFVDGYGISIGMWLLPENSVLIGEQITGSIPGAIESKDPFMFICEENDAGSIAIGSSISISDNGNWGFSGSLGGNAVQFGGSFGVSFGQSIQYSFSQSLPVPALNVEEDCQEMDPQCACCVRINLVLNYISSIYEVLDYDCNGDEIPGIQQTVQIVDNITNAELSKEPMQMCPTDVDIGPIFMSDGNLMPSGSISVDQNLNFSLFTLEWTGPNGFYAINETNLDNLEFGTYCYKLTSCGCETPIDQGCIALCADASPVGEWVFNGETSLACRDMACSDIGGAIQECLNAEPCEEWSYEEESNECFRDICYDGEVLFPQATEAYDVEYEYDENQEVCRVMVYCEEGGSVLEFETEPEYGEPFFEESEGTCLRYVICGGTELGMKDIGIEDIEWEYDEFEGCLGTVACNDGSFNDGEVSGFEATVEYFEWEYDFGNDCYRDVECSFDNNFEEIIYSADQGEQNIDWTYNSFSGACTGQISCSGEFTGYEESYASYGDWDVSALYGGQCIREAICGAGEVFTDYGDFGVEWATSSCYENSDGEWVQECYAILKCNGEAIFEDNQNEYEIPCGGSCPGGRPAPLSAATNNQIAVSQKGRHSIPYSIESDSKTVTVSAQSGQKSIDIVKVVISELVTGRVIKAIHEPSLSNGNIQFSLIQHLPIDPSSSYVPYVLTLIDSEGEIYSSKFIF